MTALHAQTMPVATFLTKAEALKKRGRFALLSSDYVKLKAEVNNSAKALGAEQSAARKAGRQPATCMPKNISIGTDELLNHFRSLPRAQHRGSVKRSPPVIHQQEVSVPFVISDNEAQRISCGVTRLEQQAIA